MIAFLKKVIIFIVPFALFSCTEEDISPVLDENYFVGSWVHQEDNFRTKVTYIFEEENEGRRVYNGGVTIDFTWSFDNNSNKILTIDESSFTIIEFTANRFKMALDQDGPRTLQRVD